VSSKRNNIKQEEQEELEQQQEFEQETPTKD
jgi:hypothetical protein